MDLTDLCFGFPLCIQLEVSQQLITNRSRKSRISYTMGTMAIDE
jgi:hypothetical protein